MPNIRSIRDTLMFILGAGGFAHEVTIAGAERPTILLACLALMGVPVFLRKDEARAELVDRAAQAARGATPTDEGAPAAPGDRGEGA